MAKKNAIVWHLDAQEVHNLQDQGKLDAVFEELKQFNPLEDIQVLKKKIDDIINS